MESKIIRKVPNGKLLKVKIVYSDKIDNVTINGDFFLHPEEGINLIEKSLKNLDIKSNILEIEKIVQTVINENTLEISGFIARDIAEIIFEGINK